MVELTSSMAEAFAALPSALIPTDCAVVANVVKIASKIISFFIRFGFLFLKKEAHAHCLSLRGTKQSKGERVNLPASKQRVLIPEAAHRETVSPKGIVPDGIVVIVTQAAAPGFSSKEL